MKYQTIIIEDEPLALQRLARLLQPYSDFIDLTAQATNGEEAVEMINALKPDLIFLDIQLPELNGFEVLARLTHVPLVIFSTAYDEFALKAFETNSIDYLLKPVEPERLQRALEKLRRLTGHEQIQLQTQLQNLLAEINKPKLQRLQVRAGDRIRLLDYNEILFFRAVDKYVEVHTHNDTHLLDQSLNQLEAELPAEQFVRIHRAVLVNMKHVLEIVRGLGGNYRVRMRDKKATELPVSRASKSKLRLGHTLMKFDDQVR
ncbi:response regulator transcription factor [candidate division KSB1 bacterium]|nr:response regulator transcription factor [candidate division KSB1 bacterium]